MKDQEFYVDFFCEAYLVLKFTFVMLITCASYELKVSASNGIYYSMQHKKHNRRSP